MKIFVEFNICQGKYLKGSIVNQGSGSLIKKKIGKNSGDDELTSCSFLVFGSRVVPKLLGEFWALHDGGFSDLILSYDILTSKVD